MFILFFVCSLVFLGMEMFLRIFKQGSSQIGCSNIFQYLAAISFHGTCSFDQEFVYKLAKLRVSQVF